MKNYQEQKATYKSLNEDFEEYTPEVSKWEVEEYENQFKDKVYHDVKFNREGDEGYSMKLYKGKSGVEAVFSGTILLSGENYIEWKFSLQNGLTINASLTLDSENFDIFSKLYNFYKIWREEWSKSLTIPKDEELAVEEPLSEAFIMRKRRSRDKLDIINDHSDRMRRLAGLK